MADTPASVKADFKVVQEYFSFVVQFIVFIKHQRKQWQSVEAKDGWLSEKKEFKIFRIVNFLP